MAKPVMILYHQYRLELGDSTVCRKLTYQENRKNSVEDLSPTRPVFLRK